MSVSAHAARRPGPAALALALAAAALLGSAMPAAAADPSGAVKVPKARPGAAILVTYRDGATMARGGADVPGAKAVETVESINVKVFRANPGQEQKAMNALATGKGVVAIETDVQVESTITPNDSLWLSGNKWAHDKVGLRTAWDTTRGASRTVIAILDSGLEVSHPDLYGRVVPGYDFVEGDTTTNDPRGHGTMSAGAAAARGNNSIGVAGSCWYCGIMPVRVLNQYGTGYASSVVRGITWAADHGADVISMSFGGFAPSSAMADAVAYARRSGAVVIASAGNNGNTSLFYPAAYSGVISVSASDASDRPYSWSNRGSWVDLTAPGCFVTTRIGKTYGNFCGTSASAPLVSGIVGLMRSANPSATRGQVEKALLSTATPMSYVGNGRANAPAAINAIRAVPSTARPGALNAKTTTGTILRSGANTTYRAITTLATGTTVPVTGPLVSDPGGRTWAPVRTASGATGYVAAWLPTITGSAAPTVNVILRATPSTSAKALVTITKGTRVTVLGSTRDPNLRVWLKVRTSSGQTGYMAAWLMRP